MNARRMVVAGGGAAGFFAAIACAEATPDAEVTVLEKSSQFLSKVRISGGGRCNVTHACFDGRELAERYPRGERALLGAFRVFQPQDTVAWFESRGVRLKTEKDGRIFPVSDSSQTIIDCLLAAARKAGVKLHTNCGLESVRRRAEGGFELGLTKSPRQLLLPALTPALSPRRGRTDASDQLSSMLAAPTTGVGSPLLKPERTGESETVECDCLLLATGGCRVPAGAQAAVALGHTLEPPVASLFTFHIETAWLRGLAGVSVAAAEVTVPGTGLSECGPLLVTHWGVSGPVVLRLSAWRARELHGRDYRFPLHINWLPQLSADEITRELASRREQQPAKLVVNSPVAPLPARLWEQLVSAAGIGRETRWSALSRAGAHQLARQLQRTEFAVTGKSLNKDEFVTCGGVKLGEVNFKTMESRICPGLYFAGELLDIDGITGGFNFQAAWTTGWIAGRAMAGQPAVAPQAPADGR